MTETATCRQCGTESPEGFRFCPSCGAPLPTAAERRQARKVVTALFCDITGSTALGEELDPEVLRGVLNRYFKDMRATIERHGGTVDKFVGDAVMAVFGIPTVQEDDALRAVRAAAEIRERLPAISEEVGVTLRFRTGVNTGPVLMGEGENIAVGDAVNVAARLEQAAQPGEVLLGQETLGLVRDAVEVEPLEPLELRGKSERIPAYRLVHVDPAAPGFARHLDVPLVGRRRELRLLGEAWDRAVQESGCHLFTLLGAAGVGKSRLIGELLSEVREQATVLRGRCLHYGEGITFWPLVEALMPVGEPAQQVLDQLTSGSGVATAEELFWDVRRLLESLAAERPVIFWIDDLHWAEPMLLDLLDHVADLSRGAPILVLCTARPELLEDRPGWGGGKLNATTVLLEPLGAQDAEALLDQLANGLDPQARERVIVASEGNPLFLEEMVALARERGVVSVPPTIQALLAARLERLAIEERELLERGAVEGEVFHRLAVRALGDERLGAEVEMRLAGLVRKELIRPHPATLSGDDAFRFRHLLIRDAAYDGLPKAVRAELHERFARWLEAAAAGLAELDEIAGWHLEQAVRYRRELGRDVEPDLPARAAEHLHAAGWRAGARSDTRAASNLLERALALAPTGALRARVAVDLAEQLIESGDQARVDELLSLAEQDPDASGLAALIRIEWVNRARPHELVSILDSLPELLERFAADGDERGLAKAHTAAFYSYWIASQATPAGEELRKAAEHARSAGDEGLRDRTTGWYVATLVYGPRDSGAMVSEFDRLEREEPGPYVRGFIQGGRSVVEWLEGHPDEARVWAQRMIETFGALGNVMESMGYQHLADVALLEGDNAAEVELLKRADAMLLARGEQSFRSTNQARLAEALERSGDRDGALAAADLSEELGASVDVINYAIAHGVRARLALADGEDEPAERWARSAVHNAFLTDFPVFRGNAKLALAEVLSGLGRRDEALAEASEAYGCYESKGDRPGMARAQAVLDRLGPGT